MPSSDWQPERSWWESGTLAERRVEDMPLRDVFTEVEQLARELVDHLENGFLPKANGLRELVQKLGGPGFVRIRVGIGRPQGSMDTKARVLSLVFYSFL